MPITSPTREAMAALMSHTGPGNVRELENALEHALVLSDGAVIDVPQLPPEVVAPAGPAPTGPAPTTAASGEDEERRRIRAALAASGWHRGRTAASLGMSRSTLWRKMRQHGLGRGESEVQKKSG